MKILVFSDSHLTDKFEEKKFYFLKKIIRQSDFVIINGDFWDGYLTTFNRFISSNWSKLFPLLKLNKILTIAVGSILENVSLLQLMLKRVNRIIKKKVKKELGIKEMFVCGHSH